MKTLVLFLLFSTLAISQTDKIILDEEFDDWNNISTNIEDVNENLGQGVDFKKLWITNDDKYLFIRIDFYDEIIIQEDTSTIILIDTDNNNLTGSQIYNSGAEIKYLFGKRQGYFYTNNDSIQIGQNDIKIISAPTVSSSTYEMKINLSSIINNHEVFPSDGIGVKFINYLPSLDLIPNGSNTLSYQINNDVESWSPEFSINKIDDSSIRVLSYNVHRDDIFNAGLQPHFSRILKTLNPDIITFQEIYDHSSMEVMKLIETILPSGNDKTWYHSKIAPIDDSYNNRTDVIIISRFPILDSYRIQGMLYPTYDIDQANAAHVLDLPDTETNLLVVNAHPPCCNNYYFRGIELQEIMAFVKDAKGDGGELSVDENTPIIITGDMNLVGPHAERDILVFGDLLDNDIYGEDFNPDWDNTPFADSKPYATGFPGVITWYDESSSFSAGRLDYIIYSDYTLNLLNSFSLFTPAIDQSILDTHNLESTDAIMASDHLPLVADFKLKDLVGVNDELGNIPNKVELYQNYPNPFNPSTTISFSIPKSGYVNLTIYNVLGQSIKTLINENLSQGFHDTNFDASDLQSGIYYYKLNSSGNSITQKLVLLK